MADAVSSKVTFQGTRRYVIQLMSLSDGTGESNVLKVDKSALIGPSGTAPTSLTVEKVEYDVSSMRVALSFDHTVDEVFAVLQGSDCLDFTSGGGYRDTGTGDTGDILLSTSGAAAGDGYNIKLHLLLQD